VSLPAHAFEREWHLGAGLGVVAPSAPYRLGAAASVHAAYGVSDVFDARLSWTSSFPDQKGGVGRTSLSQGALGLAYKIDVIEWIPYAGVRAGFFHFGSAPAGSFARTGASIGWMAGLDYAVTRSFGLGAEVSYDMFLAEGGASGALIRAEYRWGF
jgi:opacity protein-like surface antigen